MTASAYYAQVQNLYVAYFGRPADKLGLEYYAKLLAANGGNDKAMLHDFANSAESKALYNQASLSGKIASMYQTLFGREGDLKGIAYWASEVQLGNVILSEVAAAIAYNAQEADKAAFAAKLTAADVFTAKIDTTAELVAYETNPAQGRTWLASVKDAASATAATATIDATLTAIVSGTETNAGTTSTLTAGTDNVVGTAADDTITAGVIKAGDGITDVATLTLGDAINGGAGTDTLNLIGNLNVAAFNGANVKNVERVVAQISADGGALDVSNNADVKEAWISNSTVTAAAGDASIGLTKTQIAGIQGNIVNNNAAVSTTDINVVFTATTGTADAATIAVDTVKLVKNAANTTGKLGVTVAGIETLTIAATGTNNIGVLTAVDAAKLVITGSGSLTAELSDTAKYKTVDASANTGGVTIDARAANVANQVLDIKGGSGNDTYTTLFARLTKEDKIDLGAGNDKLLFADATDLSTAAAVENLKNVVGVETLGVVAAANLTVDADLVAQNIFQIGSTGAFAGTNMSTADKLVVSGAAIAVSTIGMKTGQNTTAIDLAGSAAAAADGSAGVTVTGASTINLTSSGTAGVAVNKLALTTDANGTINLSGAKDLVLTTTTAAATAGLSIQAGSFTGRLEVIGSAQNDIVVTGSAADIVRASAGADSITLGAGKDVITYTAATQTLTDVDSATGIMNSIDKVLDWSSADDKLHFNGVTVDFKALTASQQGDVTAAADLKVALELAAGFVGAAKQTAFTFGGNTYVFVNEGTAAAATGDYLVQLVGTHSITADNFAASVTALV